MLFLPTLVQTLVGMFGMLVLLDAPRVSKDLFSLNPNLPIRDKFSYLLSNGPKHIVPVARLEVFRALTSIGQIGGV